MRLISIESKSAKKLFWGILLLYGVVAIWTLNQENPVLVAASFVVALIGLWPLYFWLLGLSHGLPIWPAFAAYLGALSALPVLQGSKTLDAYSQDAVLVALATVGAFLLLGSTIWVSITSGGAKPPKKVLMLESGTAVRSLFWCLAAGLLFNANAVAGWVSFPGNTMQVARGVTGGLAYLGTFALAYFHGAGVLKRPQIVLYLAMLGLLVLYAVTGLLLAPAVPFLALALIGFSLGSGRLPIAGILVAFFAFAILHTGKYQMRDIYYNSDGTQKVLPSGITGLPSFYTEWATYGFQSIGGFGGLTSARREEDAPSSVFDRAGNLHNLLLVQDKSPSQVPFLNGITYETIPMMLLPRFLLPDKAISHAGNIILSVNYGVVDVESSRSVSIGWSLIAEAYANFGFLGVFLLAVFLSCLYSFVTRMTTGVPITSFRFVAGLVVLAGITNENSLGVFITMQFQGVVGVALASVFLMRRQPNPYTEGEEVTTGLRDQGANGPKDDWRQAGPAKWGGQRPPKWAPLSHRKAFELAAARRKAEAATDDIDEKYVDEGKAQRPRQVAVPIQPYYYRSRKA